MHKQNSDMPPQNTATISFENNEQRFRNIFISAGVGIAEVSTDGNFIMANDSFSKIIGYSAKEIPALNFSQITHPDDIEVGWKIIKQLLSGKKNSSTIEKRYYHKNGTIVWANLTVSLVRDTTGAPLYLISVLVDITKQKLIEQQLKKLSQAIEQSPVSVVITDTQGIIEYVNPIFSTVTGYAKEEVVGKNPRILKSGNFPREFYQKMWQTILKGDIWRGEFINKRKNGENYWENASISPIFNTSGEITHLVAVKEDITLRKEMETKLVNARKVAEAANNAKSVFLANMSHEIRTPLNAILGFAQILSKDTALTAEEKEKINIINKSGQHLLSLINNILEISKIEASRITFNPADFDLYSLLEDLQNLFSLTIQEKGLAFHVLTELNVPHFITTDEGKLKQILINLINNAIKFTDQGQIELKIVVIKTVDNDIQLHFTVKDTGCGITTESLAKIFNYFEQGVTHNKGGTGIGLALTKSFVEFMGGQISVDSQLNKGSAFKFFLPISIPENTENMTSSAAVPHNADNSRLSAPFSAVGDDKTNHILNKETSASIGMLSPNIKENLHEAAINGDIESLEQCIGEIEHQYPAAAQQLQQMIEAFDFEKLLKLLKQTNY